MKSVKLIIHNDRYLHQLGLDPKESYTIGNKIHNDVYFPSESEVEDAQELLLSYHEKSQKWGVQAQEEERAVELNQTSEWTVNNQRLVYELLEETEAVAYQLAIEKNWHIGSDSDALLQLPTHINNKYIVERTEDGWEIQPLGCGLFINYQFETANQQLKDGDVLFLAGSFVTLFDDELHVVNNGSLSVHLPVLAESAHGFYDEYPDYHRSPRIIYREPEDKVTINKPDNEPTKPGEQLLKMILPPLMMLGATIAMSFLQSRGPYVLITAGTTVVTTIFSITAYFKSRKKYKEDSQDRVRIYNRYLINKSEELYKLNQEQRTGKLYHYPDVTTLEKQVAEYNHRIYEKTPLHFDFLTYRLGLGRVLSSSKITYSGTDNQKKLDELEKEGMDLWNNNRYVEGVPITTELTLGPIGYIGPRSLVIEQLQLLVNQLSFFHSYHDLQFITIFPEDELEQWSWMRWLPHATLQDMNVRGFVYHQRSRDQVLNSLTQILKNRKNAKEENKRDSDSTIFTPHYVVLITDVKLILDHTIMEFFNEDPTELGCSIIFVQDVMSSLSENVKTVIDIRDRNTGVMILENGELKNTTFALDHFPSGFDKEKLPRALAPLNHLQNLKNSIPESVTFMEMYEVERFEELDVQARWAAHSPHKSLAVPLGLRGKEDVVMLNLHEKAHGPHGLVAGTTGSGKSEIIQSYILSLAVNFHPYDVAFLLIDYKGGGMANLFRNLPHLLGSITNLDGAQSMRALISINAELKRRQRLFSENNVNHINQYQKLYKDGDVSEPMPHLFLISDEFAELKSEQPEFMKELVSTARIGRSLGIHLILATQKPSGVVNDQIWSNSKFKLALKVADRADSMEMLKTPDAAEITQAGRAYLQVGNNEIYELFQSAWSGADYQPDKDETTAEDLTVYAINDLGQYDILSEDLSGLENADEVKSVPTELDAVIDGIHDITEAAGIEPLPRPWLPPLEDRVSLTEISDVHFEEEWKNNTSRELITAIGVVDLPHLQAQTTHAINLSKDGHMAIFSSPGFGKSTFMQSVFIGLARQHTPEHLVAYLLDFGTNGLLSLKKYPHIADTILVDEYEKLQKFSRRMIDELKRRKKLLSEYSVADITMYEKASGKEEPRITILLDNYDAIRADGTLEQVIESTLNQISREGSGLGIHLIISSSRSGSMRTQLNSNIKLQLCFFMIDSSEVNSVVGRTSLKIDEIPGRGMVRLDEPSLFQAALPNAGENPLEIIEGNQKEASSMREAWKGELPRPIPMVPEEISVGTLLSMPTTKKSMESYNLLPIGIDFEFAEPTGVPLFKQNTILLAGSNAQLKEALLPMVKIASQKPNLESYVFDVPSMDLLEIRKDVTAYSNDVEQISEYIEDLFDEMKEREEEYLEMVQDSEEAVSPIEFYQQFERKIIILNKITEVYDSLETRTQKQLFDIVASEGRTGIGIIGGSEVPALSKAYGDFPTKLKASKSIILTIKVGDQSIFSPSVRLIQEKPLAKYEGYIMYEGNVQKIKLVK